MPWNEDEEARAEKARQVGLFRYGLVQSLIDPALTTRQRGRIARELAGREHTDPFGRRVRVSRSTIDRWMRQYRRDGFPALVPEPRKAILRTPLQALELAVALKREDPSRTAAQIRRTLCATQGWSPTDRTLQRHFAALGLKGPGSGQRSVTDRSETTYSNEVWTGGALSGPEIGGRKTFLYVFIDSYSWAVPGYHFGYADDPLCLTAALRTALISCGVPEAVACADSDPAHADPRLVQACAILGIRFIPSWPRRRQDHERTGRFFQTVQDQFRIGFDSRAIGHMEDLAELNRLFTTWVERVYHRRVHPTTKQPPIERWWASAPKTVVLPSPARLREAFPRPQCRTVTTAGSAVLHGNTYEVDPSLAGREWNRPSTRLN